MASTRKRSAPAPELASADAPQPRTPLFPDAPRGTKGSLIIIGGHEDKNGERRILQEVRERAGRAKLVVATVATTHAEEVWAEYRAVFRQLGIRDMAHLHIETREDAFSEKNLQVLKGARAVFFTGGDQLRITSRIGGAPVCERIREIFAAGGTIAGTSAGASAMSETMLVSGPSDESHKVDALQMAPGLGLIHGVIVDQHFAERGRLGRLVGAVAQNPRLLGVGIDENTAVVAEADRFQVLGAGAVYVVDGVRESYTNVSEQEPDEVMSVFDLRLHILSSGDRFDMQTRRPSRGVPEPAAARA